VGLLRIFFSSRFSMRVHLVLWLAVRCTSVCVIWQLRVLLMVCSRRNWSAVDEWRLNSYTHCLHIQIPAPPSRVPLLPVGALSRPFYAQGPHRLPAALHLSALHCARSTQQAARGALSC
jgi:hypothetical protein